MDLASAAAVTIHNISLSNKSDTHNTGSDPNKQNQLVPFDCGGGTADGGNIEMMKRPRGRPLGSKNKPMPGSLQSCCSSSSMVAPPGLKTMASSSSQVSAPASQVWKRRSGAEGGGEVVGCCFSSSVVGKDELVKGPTIFFQCRSVRSLRLQDLGTRVTSPALLKERTRAWC